MATLLDAAVLIAAIAATAAPPPQLAISEWADQHLQVPPECSPEPGRWRTDRVPYLREPLDACADPEVEEVVFQAGAQVGKTSLQIAATGYYIAHEPAPILRVDPTLEMAEVFSKTRLAPTIRETVALSVRVADAKARDSGNTLLQKNFPGGYLKMAGANSPASLASMPIRIVMGDEIDRWSHSAGTEGDPMDLAWQRTSNFYNRLGVWTSTPTVLGASRIEEAYLATDRRRYFLPCPECGAYQFLKWEQVRWDRETDDPETARYECESCACHWTTAQIRMALPLGRWQPTATPSPGAERARGYHIWQAYSPWVSLAQIVSKYLKALGNAQRLKVFFNTVLGQTYEEPGQRVDQAGLQKRAEQSATPYEQLEIPARVLALTAGVDVQPDRIALVIRGWGPGQESWLILWEEIHGDTSREEVWGRLGDVLTARYTTQDGRELPIALAAVDTGHNTQEAYAFCRRYPRVAMAIKGSSKRGEPICASRPSAKDVSYRGETIKRGVKLWLLGTDTAKDWIHNRLKVQQPGPGYWHFPLGVGEDYYRQITSEKKETRFVNGFPLRIWTKKDGDRNEALDCEVYALAAIVRLGLDRGLLKRLEKKRPKKGQETTEAKARQAEPVEAGEEEPASMETFPAPEVELDTETEAEVQPTLKRPVGQARVRPPRRRGWMGGL